MANKDLQHEEIKKFKELAEGVRICMFTTFNEKNELSSRPMATVDIDDKGDVWFFTNEHSKKVEEVSEDYTVHLIYSHPGKNIFLNVKGQCEIVEDKNKIK
jgi:general stress protein 26